MKCCQRTSLFFFSSTFVGKKNRFVQTNQFYLLSHKHFHIFFQCLNLLSVKMLLLHECIFSFSFFLNFPLYIFSLFFLPFNLFLLLIFYFCLLYFLSLSFSLNLFLSLSLSLCFSHTHILSFSLSL